MERQLVNAIEKDNTGDVLRIQACLREKFKTIKQLSKQDLEFLYVGGKLHRDFSSEAFFAFTYFWRVF